MNSSLQNRRFDGARRSKGAFHRYIQHLGRRSARRILPALALAAALGGFAVTTAGAASVLLYDLDFDTPPHTIGAPPVLGGGPPVRETVSEIFSGDPLVVSAFGPLTDQPLVLDGGDGEGDQIRLYIDDLPDFGAYEGLVFEADLLVAEAGGNQHLNLFFDTPEIRRIRFHPDETVSVHVPDLGTVVIGGYTIGEIVHVRVDIEPLLDAWTIWLNGVLEHQGPFGNALTVDQVRVTTDLIATSDPLRAAIDEIRISAITGPESGGCDRVGFSDLTLGAIYSVGEVFVSRGVSVTVSEHYTDVGPCAPPMAAGFVEVTADGDACGNGNEMRVNNATLNFDFGGTVTDVIVEYGEYGGTVSLSVNDDCRVVENFADLDGTSLGGTAITVFDYGAPGQSCGVIRIGGSVDQLSVGGQELFIDGVSYCPECPDLARSAFEDQVNGAAFHVGDSFVSGSATHTFFPFFPEGAGCTMPDSDGVATIGNDGYACSSGKEIWLNNINAKIDFGGPVDRLLLAYGEYGGNVNLLINGDCRNVGNLAALSGTTVGGVYLYVVDYGTPGQSCGTLYAIGEIDNFYIGGQEFFIDNIRACRAFVSSTDDPVIEAHPHVWLDTNRPNPFSSGTLIRFALPSASSVELTVHDVTGRRIRSLASGELNAGPHEVWWDGSDEDGRRVAAGVYHYRLQAPGLQESRRMVVLR